MTADPVAGIEVQHRSTFETRWSGVMLLIQIPPNTLNKKYMDAVIKNGILKYELLEKKAQTTW